MDIKSEVKVILFDAGGTLFTSKFSRNDRIRSVLESSGITKDVIENAIKKGNEFFFRFNESGRWISSWSE